MTRREREAVTAALEAAESGNRRGVEAILLGLLDGLDTAAGPRCEHCGRRFDWRGELEAHLHRCIAAWDAYGREAA